METVNGPNNWILTARRDGNSVTLLRCATCDTAAALPDTLWGLPVTVLADHALAPSVSSMVDTRLPPRDTRLSPSDARLSPSASKKHKTPGTLTADSIQIPASDAVQLPNDKQIPPVGTPVQLRMVCGPAGEAPWDNSALRELTLPPSLLRVENYALYRCRSLRRIRLHDSVMFWGSGILTGCRELAAVEITRTQGNRVAGNSGIAEVGAAESGSALAYFAGEVSQELDATVIFPGGILRLLFPAYRESYEENSPAHHFDYTIEGAGYPYHHCFRNREINLLEYDSLWKRFQKLGDPCALRLAWWRVRYPIELSSDADTAYRNYLCTHGTEAAAWLIRERDIPGLSFFLAQIHPNHDTLSAAAVFARERRETEALALLLEAQRRSFPAVDRFAL